jgi:hypothetical protein
MEVVIKKQNAGILAFIPVNKELGRPLNSLL